MNIATEHCPDLVDMHHSVLTVTDVESSAARFERALGLRWLLTPFSHCQAEDRSFGVMMIEPRLGFGLGLHHHQDANAGETAEEGRTGLDHVALRVPTRAELGVWVGWFDHVGVHHSGVTGTTDPMPYPIIVFQDPADIQKADPPAGMNPKGLRGPAVPRSGSRPRPSAAPQLGLGSAPQGHRCPGRRCTGAAGVAVIRTSSPSLTSSTAPRG